MNRDHLHCNKTFPDREQAHITLRSPIDPQVAEQLTLLCPARCYSLNATGQLQFDYIGCLECGACRVITLGSGMLEWQYPAASFGIEYQFG